MIINFFVEKYRSIECKISSSYFYNIFSIVKIHFKLSKIAMRLQKSNE